MNNLKDIKELQDQLFSLQKNLKKVISKEIKEIQKNGTEEHKKLLNKTLSDVKKQKDNDKEMQQILKNMGL